MMLEHPHALIYHLIRAGCEVEVSASGRCDEAERLSITHIRCSDKIAQSQLSEARFVKYTEVTSTSEYGMLGSSWLMYTPVERS